jgi:hypothetical protein
MFQSAAPIPEEQIRRAVEEVFRSSALRKSTFWSRLKEWLLLMWHRFWDAVFSALHSTGAARPVSILIITLGAIAILAILMRMIWLWRERGRDGARGIRWMPTSLFGGEDPWAQAQSLAAGGDYTAAAHALYGALLEAAARGQQVRLHPSKTAGDYARELRGRRSQLFSRFRDFARHYEVVIYGDQMCDRERYDRLFALAVPMLRADG